MRSTVEEVGRRLAVDPVMEEALARGVLNLRRAARWLIQQHGWEHHEEAIVSALRRHQPIGGMCGFDSALPTLQAATLGVTTGLAIVSAPNAREIFHASADVWRVIDRTDTLGALPGRTNVRFLVDESHLEPLCSALGPDAVEEISHPVSSMRLTLGRWGFHGAVGVGLALHALGRGGVPVLEAFTCAPEAAFLVPASEESRAHHVLTSLTGQ